MDDAAQWVQIGTGLFQQGVQALTETDLDQPTLLPGWTRRHLCAHVAANADALGRLVHWAATGIPTPMYASIQERAAGIERGAAMTGAQLRTWLAESAGSLHDALAALTPEQWAHEITTTQGRVVAAREIPWMRAREVCVHAVDLDAGVDFRGLPAPFLHRLCSDIVAKRAQGTGPALVLTATDPAMTWSVAGGGVAVRISAPLADLAAYLSGRHPAPVTDDGQPGPELPPWL